MIWDSYGLPVSLEKLSPILPTHQGPGCGRGVGPRVVAFEAAEPGCGWPDALLKGTVHKTLLIF